MGTGGDEVALATRLDALGEVEYCCATPDGERRMSKPRTTAVERLRRAWDTLSPVPGGKRVFSKMLGIMAPYTGTIHPEVVELRPGYARVQMRDRRGVRNHLKSVHAIALMNLAEVATGTATLLGLPDDARAILTGLSMDYIKKGRGMLTAECECEPPASNERHEMEVHGVVKDTSGEVVARATARWLVGPA